MNPRNPKAHPHLLDTRAVATYLGMGESKIKVLIKRDHHPLPSRRIDGFRVFWKPTVDRWLEEEMTDATPTPQPDELIGRRTTRLAS
jgi:predicted DNA-binding transcriptional regulator AlpA